MSDLKESEGREKAPKVSVIIPFYNAEAYIRETLQCFAAQTMGSFECLCVDDGSVDRSPQIVESIAAMDSRFRLVSREHSNAGASRNAGIEAARGEYLYFADADDHFETTLLEKCANRADETGADIVLLDAGWFSEADGTSGHNGLRLVQRFLPKKNVFSADTDPDILYQVTGFVVWTKFYRHSFVLEKNLRFQSVTKVNDAYFVLLAQAEASAITVVNERLMDYRIQNRSSLQGHLMLHTDAFAEAMLAVWKEIERRGLLEKVRKSLTDRILDGCIFELGKHAHAETKKKILDGMDRILFPETGILKRPVSEYLNYDHVRKLSRIRSEVEQVLKWVPPEREKQDDDAPFFSIIIPVWNSVQWLGETLDSIRNQSFENYELICVDDGSTDGSLALMKAEEARDSRVTVLAGTHAGVSAARNEGIEAASGQYLLFQDSDDLYEPGAFQILHDKLLENNLDLLFFSRKNFADSGLEVPKKAYDLRRGWYPEVLTGPEMLAEQRRQNDFQPNVQVYAVRRNLPGRVRFPEYIHEDICYTLKIAMYAERCAVIPEVLAARRFRDNSIMTGKRDTRYLEADVQGYADAKQALKLRPLTSSQREQLADIACMYRNQAEKLLNVLPQEEIRKAKKHCSGNDWNRTVLEIRVKQIGKKMNAGNPQQKKKFWFRALRKLKRMLIQ